jgi:hypothetical protein
LTREGRVFLLDEAARALLAGNAPDREAALFVGSALQAWLADGRSPFERHARVSAPRGSHRTVRALVAELLLIGDESNESAEPISSGRCHPDETTEP